jgi:Na+-driven multidrug efflux pump
MQKVSRQILMELLWLTFSLGLTTLFAYLLFGSTILNGVFDLHLHDTYFVISRWYILTPLFCFVTFIIYFVKGLTKSFDRTLSNWLLIIVGLTLIITLTFLIQTFSQFSFGSWTLYPPLSALGSDKIPELRQDPLTKLIANFLIVIQILILVMLLFFSYRWGTRKRKQSESK